MNPDRQKTEFRQKVSTRLFKVAHSLWFQYCRCWVLKNLETQDGNKKIIQVQSAMMFTPIVYRFTQGKRWTRVTKYTAMNTDYSNHWLFINIFSRRCKPNANVNDRKLYNFSCSGKVVLSFNLQGSIKIIEVRKIICLAF